MLLVMFACSQAGEVVTVTPTMPSTPAPTTPPDTGPPTDTYTGGSGSTGQTGDTGGGLITAPCYRGETGPERDCGYSYRGMTGCITGNDVRYDFGPDPALDVQALRICRATRSEGVPCEFADAVAQAVGRDVRFWCPPLSPGGDPDAIIGGDGGGFSIYTAEAYP